MNRAGSIPLLRGARGVSLIVFLFLTNITFSQTKSRTELLQGTWVESATDTVFKYKFEGDKFYLIRGNTIVCESTYKLKRRKLDTNCPGKEKLIYKIKSITDSTLVMKDTPYAFDRRYYTYVKIKK